ncbi:MAG: MFS transporter [Candidatus Komeilibacteria bacterium]|nr:MFS transporter [Candidatus Komeilibacteria bacterium]
MEAQPKVFISQSSKSEGGKLPRNVKVMGLVSLFNDISSEMIYPIVPIFLTTVLQAPASVVGLIEGVAEATASLLKMISGWLSDRLRKRKIFVAIGYSLSAASKFLMGLAASWPFVLFARFIDRFGKGTRTAARDALIVDSVDPANHGRAFGLHRAMDSAGAVIGPILALLLIYLYQNNFRLIFFLAGIPSAIGVILLLLFVKEKIRPLSEVKTNKPLTANYKFNWKELNPAFKKFLIVSVVFAVGNSSDAFLILRAQDLGLAATLTVAAYVLFNLTYSFFSYPAGIIVDKIGAKKILILGYWLFALVYLALGLIQNDFWIWFIFPVYGIYMALTDGVSKAYIARLVPKEKSGTAFGAYLMLTGLCMFVASLAAGLLWKYVDPSATFYFGAITATLAVIWFMFSSKKSSVA